MSPKSAEEWREYYAKNRERINANRKKKRMAEEDAEKLRFMNPLNLDQKIVHGNEQDDGPFSEETGNEKRSGVVQSESLRKSTIVNFPRKHDCTMNEDYVGQTRIVQENQGHQAEILCVLHKISAQLDSQDIIQFEQDEKCTSGSVHNCADEAKPKFSGDVNLRNPNFGGIDAPEKQRTRRPLLTYVVGLFIAVFLGFNTYFLVNEQVSLYTSLGYSGMLATMIAILTEAALVSFSLMASWAKDYLWKFLLYAGCSVTAVVVLGVLGSSVKNRGAEKIRNSEQAEMLKKQIISLEALEATALGIISSIDAKVYPTRVNRLMVQLNSPISEGGYTYQLGDMRNKLAGLSMGSEYARQEIMIMQWQRWAAMLWNILMASFLGFLLNGGKQKRVLPHIFESWRGYIRRPCEA